MTGVRWVGTIGVTVIVACGGDGDVDDGGTGDDASSDASDDASDDADSTGSDPACVSGDAGFMFAFEGAQLPDRIDATCQVDTLAQTLGTIDADLSCDGDAPFTATLDVVTNPELGTFAFAEGTMVRVQYHSETPMWTERWLLVTDAASGVVLIAGVDAPSLSSPDGLAPLADYDPTPLEPECAPDSDECGATVHPALHLFDGSTLFPGTNHGVLDDTFVVWLGTSLRYVDEVTCTDTPDRWWSAGAIGYPSG